MTLPRLPLSSYPFLSLTPSGSSPPDLVNCEFEVVGILPAPPAWPFVTSNHSRSRLRTLPPGTTFTSTTWDFQHHNHPIFLPHISPAIRFSTTSPLTRDLLPLTLHSRVSTSILPPPHSPFHPFQIGAFIVGFRVANEPAFAAFLIPFNPLLFLLKRPCIL